MPFFDGQKCDVCVTELGLFPVKGKFLFGNHFFMPEWKREIEKSKLTPEQYFFKQISILENIINERPIRTD